MGEFGFVQTVEDNIKLFGKQQIAGAVQARDLYKKLIYPSTADYRAIISVGGVPGSDVTIEDVKAAEVIWGQSVLKMKGNTVRRNGKHIAQSIVKVPKELVSSNKMLNWQLTATLSTNTSSSQPTAPRASSWSLILHTAQKHIFGKHSLQHTRCISCLASELL
jgi:hypothetical protein